MQIYLLDINEKMCQEWQKFFCEDDCIKIVCDDFCNFMKTQNVECIVSPANSFGVMLGGYDLAITKFFGKKLMQKVQEYIKENYGGIQPVGSAFLIDIPNSKKTTSRKVTSSSTNGISRSNEQNFFPSGPCAFCIAIFIHVVIPQG